MFTSRDYTRLVRATVSARSSSPRSTAHSRNGMLDGSYSRSRSNAPRSPLREPATRQPRDRRLDPILQPPAPAGAGHEDTRQGACVSGLTCAEPLGHYTIQSPITRLACRWLFVVMRALLLDREDDPPNITFRSRLCEVMNSCRRPQLDKPRSSIRSHYAALLSCRTQVSLLNNRVLQLSSKIAEKPENLIPRFKKKPQFNRFHYPMCDRVASLQ
jgi:hypothetical protein